MSRLLLFPILLLVCTSAMGQGFTPWNPFPHKQITMWQKPDGSHDLHYNDSMRINGNVKEHFFGLEQYTRDIHDCDSSFYSLYRDIQVLSQSLMDLFWQRSNGNFVSSPVKIDSLISENDVVWRFTQPNRRFELRTDEPLNAQWGFRFVNGNVFDSISMVVTNVDTASFLGYFDSVKTIRVQPYRQGIPIAWFGEYKVSKSAGMIQYLPFHQIIRNQIPETWSIMGFDHANGTHYGFTSSFEDFFGGFSVGDKYKYLKRGYYPSPNGMHYVSYFTIDSVVGVTLTRDSLLLDVVELGYFRSNYFRYQYSRIDLDGYGMKRTNGVWSQIEKDTAFPIRKALGFVFNDTFSVGNQVVRLKAFESLTFQNYCSNAGWVEWYPYIAFSKGLGIVRDNKYGLDSHLIAYQKAGQAPVGDMSRISGLGEVSSNPLRLFPNPANNAVYLEGVSDNALVQVFDIHGKLMISATYALGAAIPTTDLNDGVYLVRVNDGANLLVSKLMIAN